MPEIIGEYIDRLVTVEMRMSGLPRGKTHLLYDAARRDAGEPLSLRAARSLLERVNAGDRIVITCGAGVPPWLPKGESDGPPGGVAIASALTLGVGALPIFVSADIHQDAIVATAAAAGITIVDYATARQRTGAGSLAAFPSNEDSAAERAREIMATYTPTAIIAVETIGPNQHGISHSVLGRVGPIPSPSYHHLYALAAEQGIYSVGVGDGGNEIGCGRIVDDVRRIQDYGERCQCPCGGGMATTVATDALIIAAVSNWGGYGLAAMLACLLKEPTILHSPRTEERMLDACTRAGAADGAYAAPIMSVDGIDADVSVAVVRMLGQIVHNGLHELRREF